MACFPVVHVRFIVGGGSLYAQSGPLTISGKVYDQNDEPVVGAGVLIKGTTTGAITDLDGYFSLTVPDENTVIVVSSLGYVSQEVRVGSRSKFDFFLEQDAETLEESVVIAYGTQTKATVTGALASISSEGLVKAPVADFTNVLAGRLPGVTTIQTTGQPGEDNAKIFLRGSGSLTDGASTPLILVDGIERPMSSIDPNEIESLSVLKDASSTAVFGVRGANGVILVTTKRGEVGKPRISVTSTVGFQQPLSYIEQVGSYEFATFYNQKMRNDGITDPKEYFTREAIEAYRTGSDPIMYPNTDWSDLLYNDVFLETKHNINISGGTENVRYFVSLGYLFQDGLLKQFPGLDYDNNYSYNRYNFRANLDFNLTKTTTMKFNVGGIIGQVQEPNVPSDMTNAWFYVRTAAVPFNSPGMVNGIRTFVSNAVLPGGLVVADTQRADGYRVFYGNGYSQNYRTSVTLDLDITQHLDFITPGLSIGAKGGYDVNMNINKNHQGWGSEYQVVYYKSHYAPAGGDINKPVTDPDFDKTYVYAASSAFEDAPLNYSESYSRDRNWYIEFRADYNRKFNNKHAVTALLLYNQSKNYYPSTYSYLPRGYVGFVGRLTYGYKDKYLFDFSAGYNGSENFAPGKTRYGFFPSGSIGWVISEEDFMQRQSAVDFLKLRFSVGLVGNDLGTSSRFMYMESIWNQSGSYYLGSTSGVAGSPFYTMSTPGNSDVTWETALKYNVGVDLEMFRKRLTFTGDVFYEDRTGILTSPKNTPSIIATALPNLNIGHVVNRGYEISVGWHDSYPSSFMYDINANVSFARNKILYMDEVRSKFAYQNQTGGSTGRQTGLYQFIRLYQDSDFVYVDGQRVLNPDLPQPSGVVYPGDAMYEDMNGDKKIDGYDTMVYGFAQRPEYMFGLNATFGYKGFSLTMNWLGATNVDKMMSLVHRVPFTSSGSSGLIDYFYEQCWTPEHPERPLPRATEVNMNWNSQPSTLWLRDASYIRLKSLVFGYRIPSNKVFRTLGISSLEVTFTGYNLLTFSPMDFEDPETIMDNSGQYPLVKTYSFGLNINF